MSRKGHTYATRLRLLLAKSCNLFPLRKSANVLYVLPPVLDCEQSLFCSKLSKHEIRSASQPQQQQQCNNFIW